LYFEGLAMWIYTFLDHQDPLSGVSTPRGSPQSVYFLYACLISLMRVRQRVWGRRWQTGERQPDCGERGEKIALWG
ncbi:hypothetical protein, partial [Streptomyces sp. NPDC059802]|uniref:hypothetical protein n=1 Tax=Streptomyces sp. NPDC059802 TaxID=3346952 RepID=UPI0036585239